MRSMVIAATVLAIAALGVSPVLAQMGGGGGRHHQGNDTKSDQKKPQVDEKAYKAALERIPEPKEKYDPWGGARPATPDSKKPGDKTAK
jgi:glycine/D-amino acid oxidase-like deaminating enzyme